MNELSQFKTHKDAKPQEILISIAYSKSLKKMITKPAWTNKQKKKKNSKQAKQLRWNEIDVKNNMKEIEKLFKSSNAKGAYHSQFKLYSSHTYNWLDYPFMIKGGALFTNIGSVLP